MRDAVFDEFRPCHLVSQAFVEAPEVTLTVEDGDGGTDVIVCPFHERLRQTSPASVCSGHDSPDSASLGIGEEPDRGVGPVVVGHPEMLGRFEQIPAVDLGVGALLLDDEDVDAELEQVMELAGGEVGSADDGGGERGSEWISHELPVLPSATQSPPRPVPIGRWTPHGKRGQDEEMTEPRDATPASTDPDGVPGAWARNGDVEIWYQRFVGADDATPLLLINGLGSPSVAYQRGFVDELLAAGFDVVRFDNRDLGRSSRLTGGTPDDPGYRLTDMARDAVAVLDAVGWDRAVVFGQSMGGMIAQQLVIDHPERVSALASVMSTTGNREVGHPSPSARDGLMSVPPGDRDGWIASRVETERYWASPDHWDPEWVASKGAEMFDHGVDPKGTARQYRAVVASGVRDEGLANVDVPTVVIHGSADTLIDPSGGRHTASCVPGARYVEIEGMGHDLPPALWSRLAAETASLRSALS